MLLILLYLLTTCFIVAEHSHQICAHNEEWSNERNLCIPICVYGHPSCYRKCREPNSVWKDCETMCPRTCRYPKPIYCGRACQTGCFCKKGYVFDEINLRCVVLKKCPKINYVYSLIFALKNIRKSRYNQLFLEIE